MMSLTWVQEPPINVIILAPVFGYVHCNHDKNIITEWALKWLQSWTVIYDWWLYIVIIHTTSSSPTAIDNATPVDLNGRFPVPTGQGSCWSSPNKSVKLMSHLCTGWRNLQMRSNSKYTLFKKGPQPAQRWNFCFEGNCLKNVLNLHRMSEEEGGHC